MEQIKLNAEHLITLDKFVPRDYQIPIWDAIENKGYRKVIWISPRRSGKDISSWNLAIRQCLKKVCLIYYCLPTYTHIRKVIFDAISNDGIHWLDYIPKQLIRSINKSEMKITFINGSILQCIGVKNFNTSLIGTNAYALILSEFAIMESAEVFSMIRPIIAANGGWVLIVSCVAPDTIVIDSSGLKRIKNIMSSRKEYTDYNQSIYGLGGFHKAEQFYYGGLQKTLKITLETGHQIECTTVHPIWNGSQWIKSQDLKVDDLLPIQYGQQIWPISNDITPIDHKIIYMIGTLCLNGTTKATKPTQAFVESKFMELIAQYGMQFNNQIRNIMHDLDIGLNENHSISDKVFKFSKIQMKYFLRGLFDVYSETYRENVVTYGSIILRYKHRSFLADIQVILTNFGIISYILHKDDMFILKIKDHFAWRFYREIGYSVAEKMDYEFEVPIRCRRETDNKYPIDLDKLSDYNTGLAYRKKKLMGRNEINYLNNKTSHWYLKDLLAEKFYYSPIVSIEESENEVFDFVIPETNSFFSNGFISHNTPRGKNHLWHLYKMAEMLPDWYVLKQKASEIHHIPWEVLRDEKEQMDPCLYEQEYETSFERGVTGSYWGAAIDRIRNNNQICHVPHDPGLLVYVAFDIGVNDDTTAIFWQQAGDSAVLNIIDCYSNSDLGADHYAHMLAEKGKQYRYGGLFAPHDMAVREFGNKAMTRLNSFKQLGFDFEILKQQHIVESIQNALLHIPKLWIDQSKCQTLLDAMENYKREWDESRQMYLPKPAKSRWNHYADAFRYMCQAIPLTKTYMTGQDYDLIRQKHFAKKSNIYQRNPWQGG